MDWVIGERMSERWDVHRVFRGGLGVVYVVYDRHPEFRQLYAAKTFQDKAFERHPDMFAAFIREATAWVGLDRHPNIVTAHFVEKIRGKPYLFLEYVDGGDLSAWIGSRKSRLELEPILRFALQFCDGMVHATGKGLVAHRDIKPQNCLLTSSGVLKITDFGLAKLFGLPDVAGTLRASIVAASSGDMTRTGDSMGTPTHMAPEQFEDAKRIDVRADIYSFGVMLYQLLTGRLPFVGKTWDELREMHQRHRPADLPGLPANVESVVLRCMKKDPLARYQSFAELHEAVSNVFRDVIGAAPPLPTVGEQLEAHELCNKGASLGSLGFHDRAIQIYEQALKLWPEDAKTWINMGASLHNKARYEDAIKCYERASEFDPSATVSWLNKGLSHIRLGQADEAKKSFAKVLELSPSDHHAWIELGRVYEKERDLAQAEKCFRRSVEFDPDGADAIKALGGFLVKTNREREALALYDASLRLNDRQLELWIDRGVALEQIEEPELAILSYAKAAKLDSSYAKAPAYQGNALFKLGRIDAALSAYARALELNPGDPQIWVNRGICFTEDQKFRDALVCFEKAQSLGHPGGNDLVAQCKECL